jgi:hypothetical protein
MSGDISEIKPEDQVLDGRRRVSWGRVVVSCVTAIVLVAVVVGICVVPWPAGLVDRPNGDAATTRRRVDQTQLTYYCPSRMGLSDNEQYGDKEFHASAGDQVSSARYAAFGSVYGASVGLLSDDGTGQSQTLKGRDFTTGASAKTLSGSADKPQAFDVRLLAAKSGTGAVGATASWATKGDLTGLSASSCVAPSARQNFLTGPTTEGSTQQLMVANPSAKATSLTVRVWGSKQGKPLLLSTGSTLNVKAHGEASMELSSAAPNQDGLFVSVTSTQVPVAAVIRSVKASGITAMGSDFAMPLPQEATQSLLPGIRTGDDVTLIARSDKNTEAAFSWVRSDGSVEAGHHALRSGKVAVVNLSKAPDGVLGLQVRATTPVSVCSLTGLANDEGRVDFAYSAPSATLDHSALALPDRTSGELTLLNASDHEADVTVHGYNDQGAAAGVKNYTLSAHGGVQLAATDVDDSAVAFTVSGGQSVVWSARLSQHDLEDASIPGIAYVPASSLEPMRAEVRVRADPSIVR